VVVIVVVDDDLLDGLCEYQSLGENFRGFARRGE